MYVCIYFICMCVHIHIVMNICFSIQDSLFDIRLYSEHKYLEYPFDHPKWTLKCRYDIYNIH